MNGLIICDSPNSADFDNAFIHQSNYPVLVWSPRLVSHQRLGFFRAALICLSYSGCLRTATNTRCNRMRDLRINWLIEPKLEERRLVVLAGNAPASSGYQPGALLLSYGTIVNCDFEPNRFTGRKTSFNLSVGRIRTTRFGLWLLRKSNGL